LIEGSRRTAGVVVGLILRQQTDQLSFKAALRKVKQLTKTLL
jgi:hypothetical protein